MISWHCRILMSIQAFATLSCSLIKSVSVYLSSKITLKHVRSDSKLHKKCDGTPMCINTMVHHINSP